MAHTDPFTGSLIPNGVPVVRCPNGHINRADSWAEGNRCHHPGCNYIGDPTPFNVTQPQNTVIPQSSIPSTTAPAAQFENTSGTGANAVIPSEIRGLCWGAFLLNLLWCIGNRAWLAAFLLFVPFINLLMPLVLLFKGNEWAWRKRKWRSIEQFKRTQRIWAISGITVYTLVLVLAGQGMVSEVMFDQMQQQFREGVQQLEELFPTPTPDTTEIQVVTPGAQEENLPLGEEGTPEIPQSRVLTPAAVSTTQVPQVRVLLNAVNIRAGPGTNYEVIGLAEKDSLLTVLATDNQRGWYLVRLDDGRLGWVGNTVVEPINSLQEVKIAATIPPLPTPLEE